MRRPYCPSVRRAPLSVCWSVAEPPQPIIGRPTVRRDCALDRQDEHGFWTAVRPAFAVFVVDPERQRGVGAANSFVTYVVKTSVRAPRSNAPGKQSG